jgi:hypothetical protein
MGSGDKQKKEQTRRGCYGLRETYPDYYRSYVANDVQVCYLLSLTVQVKSNQAGGLEDPG